MVRTYKDLIVWQKAYALILSTYRATARFPSDERFGLVFEIRKTARSIANNIAEGHHRSTLPDYRHFLVQARGSVAELETNLMLARDLGYLPNDTLVEELGHVERLLSGLMRSLAKLQATKNGETNTETKESDTSTTAAKTSEAKE